MAATETTKVVCPFKKYTSINNVNSTDGKKFIAAFGEVEAVALEKAHGAHFSFQTNGSNQIECARRTDIIKEGEKFYNHDQLVKLHTDQIMKIYELVCSTFKNVESIQIDGEYIGGSYSHPDVERCKDCSKVQTGVFYCPDHRFFAYDIYCFPNNNDENCKPFYVNYDIAESIFKKVGMLYAEPVARGTFLELCKMSNVFESKIPTILGLPPITGGKNEAEGLVIRPVIEQRANNGSRIILKSKNDKFSETVSTKDYVKGKSYNGPNIDPEIAACIDSMVTLNRLNNVISKIGQVTRKDYGQLMKGLNCDVLEEFPQQYPDICASIDSLETDNPSKTWAPIKKYLNNKCSDLISQYFINQ